MQKKCIFCVFEGKNDDYLEWIAGFNPAKLPRILARRDCAEHPTKKTVVTECVYLIQDKTYEKKLQKLLESRKNVGGVQLSIHNIIIFILYILWQFYDR